MGVSFRLYAEADTPAKPAPSPHAEPGGTRAAPGHQSAESQQDRKRDPRAERRRAGPPRGHPRRVRYRRLPPSEDRDRRTAGLMSTARCYTVPQLLRDLALTRRTFFKLKAAGELP